MKLISKILCIAIAYFAVVEKIDACVYYFYFATSACILACFVINKKHYLDKKDEWLDEYSVFDYVFDSLYAMSLIALFLFNNMFFCSLGFLLSLVFLQFKHDAYKELTK